MPALPVAVGLASLIAAMPVAQAQSVASQSLPMAYTLGFENLHFGAGEHLGLVGADVLFEAAPGWWAGPAVYGAATGQRGGFFVLGGELQKRWALSDRLALVTGFYAGGGGGGAAPVGNGLMLRPAATLLWDFGLLQAGASVSRVRFPSGDIDSTQAGVLLRWDGNFRYNAATDAGRDAPAAERSGLGIDRLIPVVGRYALSGSTRPTIGLIGMRAEWLDATSAFHWGLETAAAAQGDAAGYLEVLGSAGWNLRLTPASWPDVRAGARAALGLSGGGAVPTGGGLIAKAAATVDVGLLPGWRLGLERGQVRSMGGTLRANTTQLWLGVDLDGPPRPADRTPTAADTASPRSVKRYEATFGVEHVLRAARGDGSRGTLDLVGIKLNRYVGDHLYLSGQAHSAFGGGAGAYSVGLVGAGVSWPATPDAWTFGAELVAGAAGGGRVATSGGAVAQGTVWTTVAKGAYGQWRLGAGAIKSLHGDLHSPLLEINWALPFGLAGR